MARLLGQARRSHGARLGQRSQADMSARAADLVRAGPGTALSTRRVAVPDGLRQRPVSGQLPRDVLLLAVAGRLFTRAADTFSELARARGWVVPNAVEPGGATWLALAFCSGLP